MTSDYLGIEWNAGEAPYVRGPLVPADLTEAQRQWMAERLMVWTDLFPSHPEDLDAESIAALVERARKEIGP